MPEEDAPTNLFTRAARMRSWHVYEAARLFCELDPDPMIKLHEPTQERVRKLEHVFNRAMQDKLIAYADPPGNWIALADRFAISVPPGLRAAVEAAPEDSSNAILPVDESASLAEHSRPQSAQTLERKSLVRIVALLAIAGFGADPKNLRASAAAIVKKIKANGLTVDDETIRKYLVEAQDTIDYGS